VAAGATVAGGAAAMAVSPQQLRDNLVASKDQIDRTVAALSEVADPNQTDLQAAFARYGEQLDRLERQAQGIKAEADGMREARQAYFAKWDTRIAQTENPTIRAEAEARRERLREGQQKIAADSQATRDAYDPFMTDLRDIRKFLAADQSKDTIAVLGPSAKKAQQD